MKLSYLALCLLAAATVSVAFAQAPGFDEARLQNLVAAQSGVLIRVKAAIEEKPIVEAPKPEAAADTTKTAATLPAAKPAEAPVQTVLRLGTGFFVSGDGLFVTNATVVHGAKRIWYEADGVAYLAELVGVDVATNVALLKAKTMPATITPVNVGDTVGLPMMGSTLLRMSLPMEFGATPSLGIVQGTETQFGPRAFPTRYLRVQLGTGPGEAGAPVFDSQGRFVGMTVAVLPEIGATFVLPSRAIGWVKDGLLAGNGSITYGYFGFHAEEDRVDGLKLIVKSVDPKAPADVAGLKVGDVITSVAKKPCNGISDLRDAAFFTKPGQYLDMTVKRGGSDTAIAIQAGQAIK